MKAPTSPGGVRAPRSVSRTTGWWGTVLAITALSSMLSTLVFAVLFLRSSADSWPPAGAEPPAIGQPLAATALLLASWIATVRVQAVARRGGRVGQLLLALLVAGLFGAGFLAVQLAAEWRLGLSWQTNVHDSLFLVTAGFHHVGAMAGLGAFAFVLAHLRGAVLTPRQQTMAVVAALFWHYVAGGWLVVFATLYLLPRLW